MPYDPKTKITGQRISNTVFMSLNVFTIFQNKYFYGTEYEINRFEYECVSSSIRSILVEWLQSVTEIYTRIFMANTSMSIKMASIFHSLRF